MLDRPEGGDRKARRLWESAGLVIIVRSWEKLGDDHAAEECAREEAPCKINKHFFDESCETLCAAAAVKGIAAAADSAAEAFALGRVDRDADDQQHGYQDVDYEKNYLHNNHLMINVRLRPDFSSFSGDIRRNSLLRRLF